MTVIFNVQLHSKSDPCIQLLLHYLYLGFSKAPLRQRVQNLTNDFPLDLPSSNILHFSHHHYGKHHMDTITICDPVDCSLPGSSVHEILQARILEWVAISFSRGSSRPRDRTRVFCIGVRRFNLWATREVNSTEDGPILIPVIFE